MPSCAVPSNAGGEKEKNMKRRSILSLILAAAFLCVLPIAGCGEQRSSISYVPEEIEIGGTVWHRLLEKFVEDHHYLTDQVRTEIATFYDGKGFRYTKRAGNASDDYWGVQVDEIKLDEETTLQDIGISFICNRTVNERGEYLSEAPGGYISNINYQRRNAARNKKDYYVSASSSGDFEEREIEKPPMSEEEAAWAELLNEFIGSRSTTKEVKLFAYCMPNFALQGKKYVADELVFQEGVVCKNAEIALDADGKIEEITYELRFEDDATYDLRVTVDSKSVSEVKIPKPSDHEKMTEEEWRPKVEAFVKLTNYTVTRKDAKSGETIRTLQFGGDVCYEPSDEEVLAWSKEGEFYYLYKRPLVGTWDGKWRRSTITEDAYNAVLSTVRGTELNSFVMIVMRAIQNELDDFAFDKGVYTSNKTYPSGDYTIKDVEVTMNLGSFMRIVYTLVGGYDGNGADEIVTIDEVGYSPTLPPQMFTAVDDAEEQENTPND